MNLIEALKTGKHFKRIGQTNWQAPGIIGDIYTLEEVLADDWQVQLEAVLTGTFKYKNTIYKVGESTKGNVLMKDISTGDWIEAILYRHYPGGTKLFIRSRSDFISKFEKVKE